MMTHEEAGARAVAIWGKFAKVSMRPDGWAVLEVDHTDLPHSMDSHGRVICHGECCKLAIDRGAGVEHERNPLNEAISIALGTSRMLPERDHLKALYRAYAEALGQLEAAGYTVPAQRDPSTPEISTPLGLMVAQVLRAAKRQTIVSDIEDTVDAQIDFEMAALGRSLKTFARQSLIPRQAAAEVAPTTTTSPGEAAGLDMVVIIEKHGFRTDPWWVWFRLSELPAPGNRPVVEEEQMFCAGQFQTEDAAQRAVDAIKGITLKEVRVRK